MEKAIQKAIKGGFLNNKGVKDFEFTRSGTIDFFNMGGDKVWSIWCDTVLLKPEFWKALGKAEGWKEEYYVQPKLLDDSRVKIRAEYIDVWHRFIDALASGQSPDEFFTTLLSKS